MNGTTSTGIIDRLTQRAGQLYSMPAVAMEVTRLTDAPQVDVEMLRRCIERDPALTAKILRVVNSSMFVDSGEVADLGQALTLLGTKPLKLLVLGFSLPHELTSNVAEEVLRRYWQYTLIKAVAARQISERFYGAKGDEPFLAGLLQDLGMLVLIRELDEAYLNFLDRAQTEGVDLIEVELATLGFDHVMLSARLLDHWGFPASIVAAVATPCHQPGIEKLEGAQRQMGQILHLADLAARLLVYRQLDLLPKWIELGRDYADIDTNDLSEFLDELSGGVAALADCLEVRLPPLSEESKFLQTAHDLLARVAEEACCSHLGGGSPQQPAGAQSDVDSRLHELSTFQLLEKLGQPDSSSAKENAEPGIGSALLGGLESLLLASIQSCRQTRRPLSLLLVEFDDVTSVIFTRGSDGLRRCVGRLESTISEVTDHCQLVPLDDGRFAVILDGVERQPAVGIAREIVRRVRDWSTQEASARTPLTVSVGIASLAMPPRSFPSEELIEAAERCLSGVKLSGGDGVKSIMLC